MQFESKVTPDVIAKDEVLKQSQNQTQSRFSNFKKRLLRFARNDKIGVFQSSQIRDDKGFTFLQVLIVVGIIAVLAGIALARFNSALNKARVNKARAEIEMMGRAIEQIEEDTENYIESLEQLDDKTSPDGFSPWWGPYLSSLPKNIRDPWNTNYAYFFWTTTEKGGKQFQMGNYPSGPPGKDWDKGKKTGWGDGSLPPGLWKKLTPEEGLSAKGFLIVSAGPDREMATDDDIE